MSAGTWPFFMDSDIVCYNVFLFPSPHRHDIKRKVDVSCTKYSEASGAELMLSFVQVVAVNRS